MRTNNVDRAIHTLRFWGRYRRWFAAAIIAWGVVMASLGWWMFQSASQSTEEYSNAFPDHSGAMVLLALIGIVGLLSIVVGGVAVFVGMFRFFVPDPKVTVLLELVDREEKSPEIEKLDA